jgi:hypothetical protein
MGNAARFCPRACDMLMAQGERLRELPFLDRDIAEDDDHCFLCLIRLPIWTASHTDSETISQQVWHEKFSL